VSKIRLAVAGFIALAAPLALPAAAHADGSTVPAASHAVTIVAPAVLAQGGFVSPALTPTPAQVTPSAALPLTAPATSQLPFTGGDVAGLSVLGAGLLGAGVVLVRRNRVRPVKTDS
jgi:hypothetical protein